MSLPRRLLSLAALVAAPSLAARPAAAQIPLGGEFQVNVSTTGNQVFPWAAAAPDGSALVVWMDRTVTVMSRAYDPSGGPRGGELPVNLPASGIFRPSVAAQPAGFVAVWMEFGSDGSGYGIFGRRHDLFGNASGAPFRVNSYTTGEQGWGRVAADGAGNFVVVWTSYGQDGSQRGVFGQRFESSGAPRGAEFQVNTYTLSHQELPAVGMGPDGRFVVAWRSQDGGSTLLIQARRYDAQGTPSGPPFQVSPGTRT